MKNVSPALQVKPRELRDVLMADRERMRAWLRFILLTAEGKESMPASTRRARIITACQMALSGEEPL